MRGGGRAGWRVPLEFTEMELQQTSGLSEQAWHEQGKSVRVRRLAVAMARALMGGR